MNDSRRSIALKSTAVLFATVVGGWFFSALKTDLFLSFQYIYIIYILYLYLFIICILCILYFCIYIYMLGDNWEISAQ